MPQTTLKSIFDATKEELALSLQGLTIPNDSSRIQRIITEYLEKVCDENSEYSQSLTQSEDYIFQAALQLLKTQLSIADGIVSLPSNCNESCNKHCNLSTKPFVPILGAGVGSAVGGIFGSWSAVCGAIAGAAITIYVVLKSTNAQDSNNLTSGKAININVFVNIVSTICENIDNLMGTYRVQVKRLKKSYEQKEEVTIMDTHAALIEKIADVISEVNSAQNTPANVTVAVKMLTNALENYGLTYVNGRIINNN